MLSHLVMSLALAVGGPPGGTVPDQIRTADGRVFTGRILCETNDELTIHVGRGTLEIDRKNVVEVRSIEHSLADFIHRWDTMPRTDPVALAELARFCESRGLPGEAYNLWLRIMILQPDNEQAAQAIGASRAYDTWQLNTPRGWMRLSTYLGAKEKWINAVSLNTAHFIVRTDLPLEKVLEGAIQLERHYLRFYGFLGSELGLYTFAEVPEVNVYANVRNYPMPPLLGEESWFQPGINQLNVLARDPLDLRQIQRDISEMLLYNSLRQSSGHNGEILPFASRGLAEYFAASAGKQIGDPWAPLGTPSMTLFKEQAAEPKPFPLNRLLTTAGSEFRSGPYGEQRSVYAYTFMEFLLNGDNKAHREAFFRYLRAAWLGAGGTRLLFTTLGMKEQDLQKRWWDSVQKIGGRKTGVPDANPLNPNPDPMSIFDSPLLLPQ